MSVIEWLQYVYAICTSGSAPVYWREIAIVANVSIAIAYFWIPLVMAIVFRRWKSEIPFPWIWAGFVAFIAACGLSHIVHAFHALTDQTPYSTLKLAVLVGTALISILTAIGFTILLPRIMKFASPSLARLKLERAVAAATADLERALEHEKLLLREVHHRVKNNLQVTASLVNLHIRRSRFEDTSELAALRDRITAMADVHAQLQQVGIRDFSVKEFTTTLVNKIRFAYGREDIEVEVTGENFGVPLDHAASLALVLNEVISNAFKHAFEGRSGGHVRIHLGSDGEDKVIRIRDDGRGLPAQPLPSRGIGQVLIASLAVQLGADTEWRAAEGGGTEFVLRIRRSTLRPDQIGNDPNP
jgi:two-component sensor histidine kinase